MFKSKNLLFIFLILLLGIISYFIISFPSFFLYETELRDNSFEYKITAFDVDIDISENNILTITENIDVYFHVSSHGIFRMLPEISDVSFFDKNDQLIEKKYNIKYEVLEISSEYLIDSYNNVFVIQLGEEGNLIQGEKSYQIKYTANLGNDRINEFDQFYYNVVGQFWDTTIENVSVKINFPKKIIDDIQNGEIDEEVEVANRTKVYVGNYGSTETIEYLWNLEKTQLLLNYDFLEVGEGITVRVILDEHYFELPFDHWFNVINMLLIVAFAGVAFLLYKKFSNPKMVVPVVQFSANEDFTPADVGYIIDRKVDDKDIASLIIFWAQKGYIEIIEKNKSTFLRKLKEPDKDFKSYEKTLFNSIFKDNIKSDYENVNNLKIKKSIKNLNINQNNIIYKGFKTNKNLKKGQIENENLKKDNDNEKEFDNSPLLEINSIGKRIATEIPFIKSEISNLNKSLFNSNSMIVRFIIIFIMSVLVSLVGVAINLQKVMLSDIIVSVLSGVLVFVALMFIVKSSDAKHFTKKRKQVFFIISLVLAFISLLAFFIYTFDSYCDLLFTSIFVMLELVLIAFLIFKFNVRTDEGVSELGDIVGLKNFIEVAEKDRLEMLVQENPSAFYEILPYAYILGVYEKWCKKFEKISIAPPNWYVGNNDIDLFNTVIFIHVLNNSCNQLLRSIDATRIASLTQGAKNIIGGSGSGGLSGGLGGGFAGGGFGGGGGGRW